MQLSSLIGKSILSPSGEQLGYVTGAYLTRDMKALSSLAAADAEEEEFYLPARAIRSNGDALIANKLYLPAPAGVPAPIGAQVFTEKGEELGVVGDWLFGDCEPVIVVVKDGVRTGYPADTAAFEKSVIVYTEGSRPAKRRAKSVRKKDPVSTENDVSMSENQPQSEEEPASMPETPAFSEETEKDAPMSENHVPTEAQESGKTPAAVKYDAGGRNLLGRRVVRSVFDAYGNPVALAGERITPEIISQARRKGKLLSLTVNTISNIY